MIDRSIGGVICPLVTPLHDHSGAINEAVLQDLVDALLPDLDGIFTMGSSGELPWLTGQQSWSGIANVVKAVNGRLPVYVGAGDTSLKRTRDQVSRAADSGADFLVVAPPFYYPIEDSAMVEYFEALAGHARQPVILYNIPQNTHNPIHPTVAARLADHPNIVGLKDSAGDMFAFLEFLQLRGPDFAVMQGREQLMTASYQAGACGIISAMANFAPRLLQKLAAAVERPDGGADPSALQAEVSELATLFNEGYWLSALKAAVELCGFDVGDPVPPLTPATPLERERIRALLELATPAVLTRRISAS